MKSEIKGSCKHISQKPFFHISNSYVRYFQMSDLNSTQLGVVVVGWRLHRGLNGNSAIKAAEIGLFSIFSILYVRPPQVRFSIQQLSNFYPNTKYHDSNSLTIESVFLSAYWQALTYSYSIIKSRFLNFKLKWTSIRFQLSVPL